MIRVTFTFDVTEEKQAEYIKATAEKIKPFWEANGCLSYQIWQVDGQSTFFKDMLFEDAAARLF